MSTYCIRQKLLGAVMRWLDTKASSKAYSTCLQTIRIISRDKSGLDTVMTSDVLSTLVRHSGLDGYSQSQGEIITKQEGNPSGKLRPSNQWEWVNTHLDMLHPDLGSVTLYRFQLHTNYIYSISVPPHKYQIPFQLYTEQP